MQDTKCTLSVEVLSENAREFVLHKASASWPTAPLVGLFIIGVVLQVRVGRFGGCGVTVLQRSAFSILVSGRGKVILVA